MFALQTVLGATLLAGTALAHFTLDYPTSRGFDEDVEPNFCGGFTTAENRQPFPLGAGPIWIDSHHTLATVDAFLSTNTNPTSFGDFNTTSNGTEIPPVTNFFQVREGEYCWNVNLGNLGIGLTNGSLVTLQIQFNGGDGDLYQCADLILLSDYTVPANLTCSVDATSTSQTASFPGTPSTAAGIAASTSGSAVGTTAAGSTSGSATVASSGSAGVSATSAAAAASSAASTGGAEARAVVGMGLVGVIAGMVGVGIM